jgi:hypothetical protein
VRATALSRLRSRLSEEGGFIIVIAMVLIVIGLAAGAAALTEAVSTRGHANHDERSTRALEAADAGVQAELYRANQLDLTTLQLSSGLSLGTIITQLLTCPIPQLNAAGQISGIQFTAIATVGNPCPANSTSGTPKPGPDKEPVGHHDYFTSAFVPGSSAVGDFVQLNPKIVVAGIDDNGTNQITRRVEAILGPVEPFRTLEANHNLWIDVPPTLSVLGLKLAGNTLMNGTAATGNDLTIDSTGGVVSTFTAANISLSGGLTEPTALDYCGSKTISVTLSITLGSITKPSSGCSGLVNRSPISISASKPNCAPTTGVEVCSTDSGFGSVYDSTRDAIYNTTSTKAISFGPGDYVFCSFQTNGPVNLNPSGTHAVRIFIDSPNSNRCKSFSGYSGQSAPFQNSLGSFVATQGVGNVLGVTHPSQAQVYVVGDGTGNDTVAYSTGSSTLSSQDMFLYAPMSNVTVSGGQTCVLGTCVNAGTLAGAFVGYDVHASGTAITEDLGLLNYPLSSSLGPFYVKQYIECSPQYPLPSDPTSGC